MQLQSQWSAQTRAFLAYTVDNPQFMATIGTRTSVAKQGSFQMSCALFYDLSFAMVVKQIATVVKLNMSLNESGFSNWLCLSDANWEDRKWKLHDPGMLQLT